MGKSVGAAGRLGSWGLGGLLEAGWGQCRHLRGRPKDRQRGKGWRIGGSGHGYCGGRQGLRGLLPALARIPAQEAQGPRAAGLVHRHVVGLTLPLGVQAEGEELQFYAMSGGDGDVPGAKLGAQLASFQVPSVPIDHPG